METSEFLQFFFMALILLGPLIWIYLILYTLNWNERKDLFSDSWIIFIVWIASSFVVYIFCLSTEFGFYKMFYSNIYVTFFPLTLAGNIVSIAAVLISRENKKYLAVENNLSIVSNSEEMNQEISRTDIWKTSAIVSVLTLAMVTSLFIFVDEISTRMEKERHPKSNSGYVSFD